MSTVISVEHLSKTYRLGLIGGGTLAEDLSRWWARVRGTPDPLLKIGEEQHARTVGDRFLALDDVNFTVAQGEILGIIGRNGAGKSTILKILSQVTAPTSGQVKLKGRVASLLEVGTGFHPDLTGRENTFLNGTIMGMTKAEIRRKFDEIVAFSECEAFIDTPVKRYSSGMYVRLAFAVAAHLEPELLIIDEVLAVGDAQFQKKCLGKLGEVSSGGRTVLFVSHNMQAVTSLCTRAVLMEDGRVAEEADASTVVSRYWRRANAGAESHDVQWDDPRLAPGNDRIRLHRVSLLSDDGDPIDVVSTETPITIAIEYWNLHQQERVVIDLCLYSLDGTEVLESISTDGGRSDGAAMPAARFRSECRFPAELFLNSGSYRLRLIFLDQETRRLYNNDSVIEFTVHDSAARSVQFHGRFLGVIRPRLDWRTEMVTMSTGSAR